MPGDGLHIGAGSAAEKIAIIIDSIEFCTACHAGRGFEPRPAIWMPAEQDYLLFSGKLGRGVLVV